MRNHVGKTVGLAAALALAACGQTPELDFSGPVAGWTQWGGGQEGMRYSPLTQITPDNVGHLEKAWTYHIGALEAAPGKSPTLESTPILAEGRLYLCSGRNKLVALDPENGRELWSHDPEVSDEGTYLLNCRGVTYWQDASASEGQACRSRIFSGTIDGRLLAVDAATGRPCGDFGRNGTVSLLAGLGETKPGEFGVSSPPVVIDDLVVVGGRVADNMRVDVPAGVIRAYDARSGALRWAWNPLPPGYPVPAEGAAFVPGTPNAWAALSVDVARKRIYVPTGNAAPDHFSAIRKGLDYYASSVVALDATTGQPVWRFQTVHKDVWDYDVPAQPVLFDLPTPNGVVPALAQATKQGHLFILNRETGEPVFPVEERPVPQGGVAGEVLSPTQPFPAVPDLILRRDLTEDDIWGFTPWDKSQCMEQFRNARWEGVFTPPSTQGTIFYPSFMGTSNWGSVAVDPTRSVLIANTTHVPAIIRLIPRAEADRRMAAGERMLPAFGAPYANTMAPMLSPFGAPCVRPPWGTLTAIDLKAGKRLWEVPLGTTRDVAPFPLWMNLGVPNMGGAVITASGLVFIAATTDNYLRAFDLASGRELTRLRLPAGGQATPMTYRLRENGKQYVVIAAGGHKYLGTTQGDALVAYALPD